MHEFPESDPDPEAFNEYSPEPEREAYESGEGFDPTNGIVPTEEANYDAPDGEPVPEQVLSMPADPFHSPFTDPEFTQVAQAYDEAVTSTKASTDEALEAIRKLKEKIAATTFESPEAAERMQAALINFEKAEAAVRLAAEKALSTAPRMVVTEGVLRAQGLTVDTGRRPTDLSIDTFKQYFPTTPEEVELTAHHLDAGVKEATQKHTPYIREEQYTVDGVTYSRGVLELQCPMKEGYVDFQITPEGLAARFNPKDGAPTYSRYHFSSEGQRVSTPEDALVRRDTTDWMKVMQGIPVYGSVPSREIWAEQHERRLMAQQEVAAERLAGDNDHPISFAEAQFIRYLLDNAYPVSRFANVLALSDKRSKAEPFDEPTSADAYEAGLRFRQGMNAHFADKNLLGDDINATYFIENATFGMTAEVEVGKEYLIAESGAQSEPYVKITATRELLGPALENMRERLQRREGDSVPLSRVERLHLQSITKYGIDPGNDEMVTDGTTQYIDQDGNVYGSVSRRMRADTMEPQTILPALIEPRLT